MQGRLLLLEDHAVVRDGLRFMLEGAGWSVGGEAVTSAEALDVLDRCDCGLVVLDLNLEGEDGLSAARRIRERHPELPILVLTMHGEASRVQAALAAGVRGYVLKSAARDELLAAVRCVHAGGFYVDPRVAHQVVGSFASPAPPGPRLTERTREVLALVAEGLSNQEIADRMHLSLSSVKLHLRELFELFGVNDRVSLAVTALEKRIVQRSGR